MRLNALDRKTRLVLFVNTLAILVVLPAGNSPSENPRISPSVISPPIISPLPKSVGASPKTQISLLGISPKAIVSVTVYGSKTGIHKGALREYSDGSGASFLPRSSFAPGENVHVAVTFKNHLNTATAKSDFKVAQLVPFSLPAHGHPRVTGGQRFVSNPGLAPVDVKVSKKGPVAPGYVLMTAGVMKSGKFGWSGPLIVEPSGKVVYTARTPKGESVVDLNVQKYRGEPVLTWWHGRNKHGVGFGVHEILDRSYRSIARVTGGNGCRPDLHEFSITARNSAFTTAYLSMRADLRSVGGSRSGVLIDAVLQEVDIPTGLVKFEWHANGHIKLTDSYRAVKNPWDAYHINSIQEGPNGNLLLSFRNTSAIYEIDRRTGSIVWTLGGKSSSFKLGRGTHFSYQHDARYVDGDRSLISLFDNSNGDRPIVNSRAAIIKLDHKRRVATLVKNYKLSRCPAESQGNTQLLAKRGIFVGWGSWPEFSEFTSSGKLVLNGKAVGAQSYRVYHKPWVGIPGYPPSVAVRRAGSKVKIYASWNGATEVSCWRIRSGKTPNLLTAVTTARRTGFETVIETPAAGSYYGVEALDKTGRVLGTSAAVKS